MRHQTRQVTVRGLALGGGAPVVVQSMTNTKTADVADTLGQIERLAPVSYTHLTLPTILRV